MPTSPTPAGAGSYGIEAPVGTDGEWMLYRARHRERGTAHLLRVLPRPDAAVHDAIVPVVSRLRRLDHPNVLPFTKVLGLGQGLGLVSPWTDGVPLDVLVRRVRLSPAEAEVLAGGIAEGLAAAAALGVEHGGLDGDAVVVEADGEGVRARVAGFGLAALGTRRGAGPGAPRAPEVDPGRGRARVGRLLLSAVDGPGGEPALGPDGALAAWVPAGMAGWAEGRLPTAAETEGSGGPTWSPEILRVVRAGAEDLALVAASGATLSGASLDLSLDPGPPPRADTPAPPHVATGTGGWALGVALVLLALLLVVAWLR